MELEYSLVTFRGDTPEKNPTPARTDDQSLERVLGSEAMVKEGDLVGLDESKLVISEILDQIHEKASSILGFSLQWEEMDEKIKERAMEVDLKEKCVKEQTLELVKKEERFKEVERSITLRLEEEEKEIDVKQFLESSFMRLVLGKKEEEVMDELTKFNGELEKRVKDFDLKQKVSIERRRKAAEVVKLSLEKLEAKAKEISLLNEAVKENLAELEKKKEIFDAGQKEKAEEIEERNKFLELKEKKLKQLEAKEKEISLLDDAVKEMVADFEKKMEIFEVEQKAKAEEIEETRKSLELKEKKLEEMVNELESKQRELAELEKNKEIFEADQKAKAEETEKKRKLLELKVKKLEEMVNELESKQREFQERPIQLEAKEKEIRLLDEAVKEKVAELENKKEIVEAEQKAKAEEIEEKSKSLELKENKLKEMVEELILKQRELGELEKNKAEEIEEKRKLLELKEKKLEELAKELELKQGEFEEGPIQRETCKRARVKMLAEKCNEADPLLSPLKRHKSSQSHVDEDSGKDLASVVVSASSEHVNEARQEGDIDEIESIGDTDSDEEPEQLSCVDSQFHDFEPKMSSFVVGKVWAIYDSVDGMPRLYGRIKTINKSQSSVQVTWVCPRDDEDPVHVSCGKFELGITETMSYLTLSHEVNSIRRGKNFFAVNPKKGETWALFRDWSQSWNDHPEQHKPPYRYDLVEVISFEDQLGFGVAYLGKVEGFVSVFKHEGQHGVVSLLISPEEMHRFSHRVPSVRLNGDEKEGVPAGSFELDPAAVPSSILKLDRSIGEEAEETERQSEECGEACEVEVQDGSRKDIPIILD